MGAKQRTDDTAFVPNKLCDRQNVVSLYLCQSTSLSLVYILPGSLLAHSLNVQYLVDQPRQ